MRHGLRLAGAPAAAHPRRIASRCTSESVTRVATVLVAGAIGLAACGGAGGDDPARPLLSAIRPAVFTRQNLPDGVMVTMPELS